MMLRSLVDELDLLEDVRELIEESISPDAPPTLQDGGVICGGYSVELDEIRATLDGARDFIASLQVRERERTAIPSLKVGFNKVFGYYLEVTKANLGKVPEDFVRKQTLTNAERYFTPELKEWEEKVFAAEDRIEKLEGDIFREIRGRVGMEVARILWIDDRPEGIASVVETIRHLGAHITVVESTEEAVEFLASTEAVAASGIQVVVSDIARAGRADEGTRAIPRLREVAPHAEIIFYIADLDTERGIPDGARGITNRTDELLHLILDVLEGR